MNILFTGASSFTGAHFVRALASAGHRVCAVFQKPLEAYDEPLRQARVQLVAAVAKPVAGCSFGDPGFLDLIRQGGFDLLAHHAADVTNYKSADFDTAAALQNNTRNLPAVLQVFQEAGGQKIVISGSVFEGGEGSGSQGLPDFSPYGLSKALTARVFQFYCDRQGLRLGKFVIPNPFGPYEEPRFTAYLMKNWLAGNTPNCSSPSYVRDNIHVSLLAKAYAQFLENLPDGPGFTRLNPSGYAESQGAFSLRLAQEMRKRLDLPCHLELKKQTDFPEPRVRVNTDILDTDALAWDESTAWDEMAQFYKTMIK